LLRTLLRKRLTANHYIPVFALAILALAAQAQLAVADCMDVYVSPYVQTMQLDQSSFPEGVGFKSLSRGSYETPALRNDAQTPLVFHDDASNFPDQGGFEKTVQVYGPAYDYSNSGIPDYRLKPTYKLVDGKAYRYDFTIYQPDGSQITGNTNIQGQWRESGEGYTGLSAGWMEVQYIIQRNAIFDDPQDATRIGQYDHDTLELVHSNPLEFKVRAYYGDQPVLLRGRYMFEKKPQDVYESESQEARRMFDECVKDEDAMFR